MPRWPGAPARRPACSRSPWSTGAPPTTGDVVTTLGSVGGRPFVPGIPVGTVTTVHLGVGRLAPTGTVTPAVDTTSLDVVAVVLTAGRADPAPGRDGHRDERPGRRAAAGPGGARGRAARS